VTGLARPTPYTWTVGDIFTALIGNGVRDGLIFAQNPPNFVGTQSVAQSLPNATWTAISLDTSQTDPYSGHSNVTNSSRYTCQSSAPGWYTVCGVVAHSPNVAGFRTARIQVNGSAIVGAETYGPTNGGAEAIIITPVRDILLAAGDYVEVAGYQSSGGALNTAVGGEVRSALWLRFSHA
jgi:hypothetical protein